MLRCRGAPVAAPGWRFSALYTSRRRTKCMDTSHVTLSGKAERARCRPPPAEPPGLTLKAKLASRPGLDQRIVQQIARLIEHAAGYDPACRRSVPRTDDNLKLEENRFCGIHGPFGLSPSSPSCTQSGTTRRGNNNAYDLCSVIFGWSSVRISTSAVSDRYPTFDQELSLLTSSATQILIQEQSNLRTSMKTSFGN
jgi:hypothetical protein